MTFRRGTIPKEKDIPLRLDKTSLKIPHMGPEPEIRLRRIANRLQLPAFFEGQGFEDETDIVCKLLAFSCATNLNRMKFILGKKLEMSQVFGPDGNVIPVTLVQAGPCFVTQVKSLENDGYVAVQVGFGEAKRLAKPQEGHLKDLPKLEILHEFRLPSEPSMKRGDTIDASVFQPGDMIQVAGTSKGKGFQGVVKRHHFHGHPTTHGHKDQARMPGSIGAGGVQHVLKGRRMAGRMGNERVTVKNLRVVEVRENGVLAIKGAIPGARHSIVEIIAV